MLHIKATQYNYYLDGRENNRMDFGVGFWGVFFRKSKNVKL